MFHTIRRGQTSQPSGKYTKYFKIWLRFLKKITSKTEAPERKGRRCFPGVGRVPTQGLRPVRPPRRRVVRGFGKAVFATALRPTVRCPGRVVPPRRRCKERAGRRG